MYNIARCYSGDAIGECGTKTMCPKKNSPFGTTSVIYIINNG